MRLLLLFFSFIFLSSSSASSLATGSGILEILIESGAPTDVNFIVTFDNESHVTWRHLEPNIPELLIFDEFNHTSFFHRINVTIHDNVTSHSTITYTFQGLYDIDDLPVPYTGLQIKFKCAENRYGLSCQQPCTDPRGNWRCDQFGQHSCAEGYCGWNCHKFGSECHRFGECKCQNGGKCYPHPILLQHLVMCECPPGYHGDHCEEFKYFDRKLKFSANFGLNTTIKNKFSNRTDIYQLFEKYEKEQRTSGNKEFLAFFKHFDIAAKLWILICMVAMAGYCIYKFCGESKNEKKILETSGDKKKTSEEEKKCILIEMNDM
ncbi:hypothetical protein GCK72_015691 [Caenorhabditis remanei]|uniref:EGF-like domain-containing protein n=1 Tax=Caenorhabditis remanei TaxID=31234 RepID=A0A6A5GUR5_CAERE|nr:hypothetical protein GCK72_015691 [Caenorhabditis remanei]KAF1759230.1 hypothetical protein GCK72_015691 [Caenorhabditis remanei]